MSNNAYRRDSSYDRERSRSPISRHSNNEDSRRVQLLEMEVNRLRNELELSKERKVAVEREHQTSQQLHARLVTAYKDSNEQLAILEGKMRDYHLKFTNTDATNSILRRQVNTQYAEIQKMKEDLNELKADARSSVKRSELEKALKSALEKKETLSDRLTKIVKERDVAVNQSFADLQKLKSVEGMLSARNKNDEDAEIARTNAEAKYTACQTENSRLGELIRQKECEIMAVRHQTWKTGREHVQEIKDLRRVLQDDCMKYELEEKCEQIMRTLVEAKTIQSMQLEELMMRITY